MFGTEVNTRVEPYLLSSAETRDEKSYQCQEAWLSEFNFGVNYHLLSGVQ